jgi:hypothetical protein
VLDFWQDANEIDKLRIIEMKRYVKLSLPYAKKWHVIDTNVSNRTQCGYFSTATDEFKAVLNRNDKLCQTCMIIEAHRKQTLHRAKELGITIKKREHRDYE